MNQYLVETATRRDVGHLIGKHYLGRWPGVVVCILGLLNENQTAYIGVIVFALPPRETAKRYGVGVAWELARLFIEDCTPKNTESWFMSRAIAHVRRTRPEVDLLVSYADPSVGHCGTIYKAANWISDGRTDQERKTARFDYAIGDKIYSRRSHVPDGSTPRRIPRVSKHRFIFWMRDHEKKRISQKGSQADTGSRSTGGVARTFIPTHRFRSELCGTTSAA